MKWAYIVLLGLVTTVWIGCGMIKPRTAEADDENCEYRTETGSRVPTKVCETERSKEERALDDQLKMEEINRNTPAELPGSTGP